MKIYCNQFGLTLIEIMVALVIGLILVTAFTGALVIGLQTEGDMDYRQDAKNIATSIVEILRSERESLEDIQWNDIKDDFNSNEIKFIDDVTIKPETPRKDLNGSNNLYEIIILIEWQERGNERSYRLETLLSGD